MLKIARQSPALSTGKSDGDFQKADTTMPKSPQMALLSQATLKMFLPLVLNSFEL